MIPKNLTKRTKKRLDGKKLVIVSNREPYVHKKTGICIKVEKSAGGLTSALILMAL